MPRLVIACARPGLIRGGVRHPKIAEHLIGAFTPDQLRELLAEPELAVVVGRPLTMDDVELIAAGGSLVAHEIPSPVVAIDGAADGGPQEVPSAINAPTETRTEAGAAADEAAPVNAVPVKAGKGKRR